MEKPVSLTRRALMQKVGKAAVLSQSGTIIGALSNLSQASASEFDDYKAIVCIFLLGGADYANTITPYDQESYNLYYKARPELAHSKSSLISTVLDPINELSGKKFALCPTLAPIHHLFTSKKLAILLNSGVLKAPITRDEFFQDKSLRPDSLFAHNIQQKAFQKGGGGARSSGWGGLISDLSASKNYIPQLTSISTFGNIPLLSGEDTLGYAMSPRGRAFSSTGLLADEVLKEIVKDSMISAPGGHFEEEYGSICSRAFYLSAYVESLVGYETSGIYKKINTDKQFGRQLNLTAKSIVASKKNNFRRQIYFIGLGGWDHHSKLYEKHLNLCDELAIGMNSFHSVLEEFGVSNDVLTFTGSEFGRTLFSNGSGTDHGWGGHQLIMGGAVKGKVIYGKPPLIGDNTSDDVGRGRLIPTTSIDQFIATLAFWFGLDELSIIEIVPNILNYDKNLWNIGFV